MTPQEYVNKGFAVSLHIDQPIIDRAEADVRAAYVTPIMGAGATGAEVDDAVANLAFMAMTQRNVFVTRSGAKEKTNANSRTAEAWDTLQEMAHTCAMKIAALRELPNANKTAEVNDICRIYFKTNFFRV